VSIPLSIICSLLMLAALGETINIMTLGGLALAVGILVDDATVEIENINRNLEEGKEVEDAILDGAAQIAVPAFVSTLAICIVFVPMFFLGGVARYLFVPAGRGGRLRHAGLLLPLANDRADDGEVSAEGA
jgi:multidrug efflux pump subunit AcrB